PCYKQSNNKPQRGGIRCKRPHRQRAPRRRRAIARPENSSRPSTSSGPRPRMDFPIELLINAIIAGVLLGGFYIAVTVGISISFGMLDIVNIAHPAFIILGSYLAYIINSQFGLDPILVGLLMLPVFYALGAAVYQVYYLSFEKRGQEALRGLAFF